MKIDLECHVTTPSNNAVANFSAESARNGVEYMKDIVRRWTDIPLRLEEMDQNNIERQVISHTVGGAQFVSDPVQAASIARVENEYLAEHYHAAYPDRFSAFANIPMQRGDLAAKELEYAVTKLGMPGALIRGWSNLDDGFIYPDEPQAAEFWDCAAELGVPVYLHPREPLPGPGRRIYQDYPALIGSAWGFAIETATIAVRLMMSDVFDRNPTMQVILGHLGEGLTFLLPRTTHRLYMQRYGLSMKEGKRPLLEYFKNNFYVTTSGHFNTEALKNAIDILGTDRILFSSDYPFEYLPEACGWFDALDLSDADRKKIESENAKKLLKL